MLSLPGSPFLRILEHILADSLVKNLQQAFASEQHSYVRTPNFSSIAATRCPSRLLPWADNLLSLTATPLHFNDELGGTGILGWGIALHFASNFNMPYKLPFRLSVGAIQVLIAMVRRCLCIALTIQNGSNGVVGNLIQHIEALCKTYCSSPSLWECKYLEMWAVVSYRPSNRFSFNNTDVE